MPSAANRAAEWLQADGLGGFASGTVCGERTRRYHALLLAATTPPTGRFVLVNGLEAWVDTPSGSYAISTQRYQGGFVFPDNSERLVDFSDDPWPRWTFQLEDGALVEQELLVPHGAAAVCLQWRLVEPRQGVSLRVRPLLSGRDYHQLHHENPAFRFDAAVDGSRVAWSPYQGVPGVCSWANAHYQHDPQWYRRFYYEQEHQRGLDDSEDLASPGMLHWNLSQGAAVWVLAAQGVPGQLQVADDQSPETLHEGLMDAQQQRRARFLSRLEFSADAYLVAGREQGEGDRGQGVGRRKDEGGRMKDAQARHHSPLTYSPDIKHQTTRAPEAPSATILAGYPWFTDWGRDTFIALRGLCLATGRLELARDILLAWSETLSQGMLPNRFPDGGSQPEYNSVDASLWYVVAVGELLRAAEADERDQLNDRQRDALLAAIDAILTGYARGTRYGIRLDDDGLLAAGDPGVQLTWMDAKVGDWVVTPRVGKPVEVQALWLNALWTARTASDEWAKLLDVGRRSFQQRFWNPAGDCLYDVVDCDGRAGRVDESFRPNQIFAVGGLPLSVLTGKRAGWVVDAVQSRLVTPLGLRTLERGAPGYAPRYCGDVRKRDSSYHQGTVWPWLTGPFVEAWVRTRGATTQAKNEARRRFVLPLVNHLEEAGLGHVSEIADGDWPHTPRGCPFQAWSVGELLRLQKVVLADPTPAWAEAADVASLASV